jgi:hypothetical protein
MATSINTITGVPEQHLQELLNDYREFDQADIVTAINDGTGTFTVESTVFDKAPSPGGSSIIINGKMSTFGGPNDTGVSPSEGLSMFEPPDVANNMDLFLPGQPPGTTGLARRLNPNAKYLACRWNLQITPRSYLRTIKVKVSNPANHKSTEARPADTGPAFITGRVADLSPGLAQALGLNTNDQCRVEIPVSADAQLPPTGAGSAAGVNLAALDGKFFDHELLRRLVVMTTSDNVIYWVVNEIGPDIGGQSLLRHAGDETAIILSDTTIFPVQASAQIPAFIAEELNKAAPKFAPSGPSGTPPQPGANINAKEFAAAKAFVDHDTSHVPGTEHGNLACAWAVNEVTRLALGKPISTNGSGGNGLSTDGVYDALKQHHTRLASANAATPGTIIIAPTKGATHGHVGIVGAAAGDVADTPVYSNKSRPGVFKQNYTIRSFTAHYTTMNLEVLFYDLNGSFFT